MGAAKFTIVIHGGAGTILKEDMTPELEKAYLEGLGRGACSRLCRT